MDDSSTDNAPTEEPEEKSFFGIVVHSFFIVPFLIAVFCVLLFTSVTLLTREKQTVYDFLEDIKVGGETKRWQAAFELSKVLANPELIPQDERFVNELISAYENSWTDDNRVRQYLALAMGRTNNPEFFLPLSQRINEEKEENLYAVIYALGMLKDLRATNVLSPFTNHRTARIRSITVVSLGNLGDVRAKNILKKALKDPEPNVQWGSAISLAKMGDASGRNIIKQLLNRRYFSQFPEVDPQEQNYLILAAIEAASVIKGNELDEIIQDLASSDQNMKVRSAAMNYNNQNN